MTKPSWTNRATRLSMLAAPDPREHERGYAKIDYAKTAYVKTACTRRWTLPSLQRMPKSVFSDAYRTMLRNLIALRKECGLSQVELARRLGKEQPFVSRIERGERRIDVVEFYAIATALGLEPQRAYGLLIENFPAQVSI